MPKKNQSNDQPEAEETVIISPPGEELMTTRELMAFLNLSRTKIWEHVQYNGLPAFKLGGDYRYRKAEVLNWLENYRVTSRSTAPKNTKKKSSQ